MKSEKEPTNILSNAHHSLDELSNSEHSSQCSGDCEAYTNRLKRYCHSSLFDGSEQISSNEGRLTNDDYELVHVHIVARHGDRTPVSNLRLGPRVYYECGLVEESINWNGLEDFTPHFLTPSSLGTEPQIQFHPGTQSHECGDVKGIGKLTLLGYKQHVYLGKLMREKYDNFVGTIIHDVQSLRNGVYVQSTQVLRTIFSLSAFMLGFLPDSIELRRATTVHISQGTQLETPPVGIETVYKHCQGYSQLWNEDRRQTGYLKNEDKRRHLITNLCGMFGLVSKCQSLSVAKVFEQLSIRGCHQPLDPLPCVKDNGPCVSYPQALELFKFTDWAWTSGHPLKTSIIATMPFLTHSILTPMQRVMDSYQRSNSLAGSYKFMVSLTHDDAITKMLTNLGVRVSEWIPYATRVVFELWKRKDQELYEVRILLNGEVVTQQCGGWREGMNKELIPYPVLKAFLTSGTYRELKYYNKLCRTT